MHAVKAHVESGRILVNEPTDLPDGTELFLVPAEDDVDLDDEERAALHEAIQEGLDDMKAGRTMDGDEWMADLRSRL